MAPKKTGVQTGPPLYGVGFKPKATGKVMPKPAPRKGGPTRPMPGETGKPAASRKPFGAPLAIPPVPSIGKPKRPVTPRS